MPVPLIRESKSAATIRRRRKGQQVPVRHKAHSLDESWDSGEEDPDLPLEPSQEGPKVLRLIMSSEKTLFLGLLAFRFINALMVQTSYVPDEYWQSIEVAHNMAFGYGYKTWEWRYGLRSYFYPGVFALVYKVLGVLHMDSRLLLTKLPRLMQSVMAALGDLYLFKLTRQQCNQDAAWWSLLCQLTSWFTFYCATRTLTNSTETVLTTMALYYFPWPDKPRKAQWKYITLVGVAVVIRPTAAIVWLPLCVWHLYLYRPVMWRVFKMFAERGFVTLSISSIIDRVFYGRWENVHYNFLKFNVLENMGSFYGSHPWHWHLTQGFAVIMGPQIFPFTLAVRKGTEKIFLAVIFWTVFVYSLLAHKEFRFLFPVLPMAMHVCGVFLHSVCDDGEDYEEEEEEESTSPANPPESSQQTQGQTMSRKKVMILLLIFTNLPLALYTSLLHQRGTLDVMKCVHDQTKLFQKNDEKIDVAFLMPCHSTPYYGYIHQNISMRFLTCEPNVTHSAEHVDEADVFFEDPVKWMKLEYADTDTDPKSRKSLPTYLVMFNPLEVTLGEYMFNHKYFSCAKFFHSHVPEGRVGSHVVVYCKKTVKRKEQRKKMKVKGR